MPRFLVKRDFGQVSDEQMQEFIATTKIVGAEERFGELHWEGTRVCDDDGAGIKAFCVYTAPSVRLLDEHAQALGHHGTHRIFEIVGDIDPRDIAG
ncbi:MAG TPA: nickel-binding protein [Thermoleophilaceae bacterium]|nr:nickel-binding protein [Thermoleophilaceae bacterium]